MKPNNLLLLLAEDDAEDRLFFQEALNEVPLDTELITVQNGEELMNLLIKNIETLPSALFLDLNMPQKNGFECLEEIKSNDKLKDLPVIIFSTAHEPTIADKVYKNGARYYICKPTDFTQLKNVIYFSLKLITTADLALENKDVFLLNNLEKMFL